jgi:hypothetical protein
MKQDNQLRDILLNSAAGASADFTDIVMKKVCGISAAYSYYQPLVNSKLIKRFVVAFGALVTAILSLCFIISLGNLTILHWIGSIPLPDVNYNKLIAFIFIFWTLFLSNFLFEKNAQLSRNR